jgi:redox-sensitive bicupin YhaK (pirin superfamily)
MEQYVLKKRSKEMRGSTITNWLDSKHSFSFGDYYDPDQMAFGPLRVINEDIVNPASGFGLHPHNNMEIISYIISGELSHKDSMGSGSVIKQGDIQLMSAGSGILHSEYNASDNIPVHFLQIWIMPELRNEKPSYQQKSVKPEEMHNHFLLVISENSENQSLEIKQNARVLIGHFDKEYKTSIQLKSNRRYWLQMIKGIVNVNEETLSNGDGLAITQEEVLQLTLIESSLMLLFDLP